MELIQRTWEDKSLFQEDVDEVLKSETWQGVNDFLKFPKTKEKG